MNRTVPILRSRVVWAAVLIFSLFSILMWIVPNSPLMEVMHSLRGWVALAVVVAYTPICLEAVRLEKIDRIHQLSLGIWMGWMATLILSVWSLLWRLAGKPIWMTESDINAFALMMSTMGATLHITAPGAVGGIVPRRNWIMLGLAFAAGAAFATAVMAYQYGAFAAVNFPRSLWWIE